MPNPTGLARAVAAGVDKVAVFAAASETFNRRNLNCDVATALRRCREVVRQAPVPARGYVSTAFHCPFAGPVDAAAVAAIVAELLDMGCAEISIGDTIGRATPDDVEDLLSVLLSRWPAACFAMHMHDTGGRAIANCQRAAAMGVARFDSSVGGLGGCPYAPGDHGNVATEALVRAFAGRVDLDLAALELARRIVVDGAACGVRDRNRSL